MLIHTKRDCGFGLFKEDLQVVPSHCIYTIYLYTILFILSE